MLSPEWAGLSKDVTINQSLSKEHFKTNMTNSILPQQGSSIFHMFSTLPSLAKNLLLHVASVS